MFPEWSLYIQIWRTCVLKERFQKNAMWWQLGWNAYITSKGDYLKSTALLIWMYRFYVCVERKMGMMWSGGGEEYAFNTILMSLLFIVVFRMDYLNVLPVAPLEFYTKVSVQWPLICKETSMIYTRSTSKSMLSYNIIESGYSSVLQELFLIYIDSDKGELFKK